MIHVLKRIKKISDIPKELKLFFLFHHGRHHDMKIKICNENFILNDSRSFVFMYREIFDKEIYKFKSKNKTPLIIDCGANIGLSALYFKKRYPQSEIIAFEPDKKVFEILKKNVLSRKYSDIKLINKALWKDNSVLNFKPDHADGGKICSSLNENTIKIESVRLRDFIDREIDFLKIDIEGAEYEVLKDCKDKLHLVNNIFIEYHSFTNEQQYLNEILTILRDTGFRVNIESVSIRQSHPFIKIEDVNNMDMQLNIYAYK